MDVSPKDKQPDESFFRAGEPVTALDIRDAVIIKRGRHFLVTDRFGNISADNQNGFGYYRGDTRYLSEYELQVAGASLLVLESTAEAGDRAVQDMVNPAMHLGSGQVVPPNTLFFRRRRQFDDQGRLEESLRLTSFHREAVTIELSFRFNAQFQDMFQVRGMERTWQAEAVFSCDERQINFDYRGKDGIGRQTRIVFSQPPTHIENGVAQFSLSVDHLESATVEFVIETVEELEQTVPFRRPEFWRRTGAGETVGKLRTNNRFFDAIWRRSMEDLDMLETDIGSAQFLAAGIPWYCTLFGRDSIITSLQVLPFRPQIAAQTLRVLAALQGTSVRKELDEQPGRILHELRLGEMARTGEAPMAYFGSVDSTPLYLMLLVEYVHQTADVGLLKELLPVVDSALDWIDHHGDQDGDGYLEYERQSATGIENQGWKDSHDGIVDQHGEIVRPPIALIEVQAYVYACKAGLAGILPLVDREEQASRLVEEAETLKRRINTDFWDEDEHFFALALDGAKRRVTPRTSNPGHALWCGAVASIHAPDVAKALMSEDLFSGWGIRTMSDRSPRFNPLGYHLGTVWPHDTAIVAAGLRRYGFDEHMLELFEALYDAARGFDQYRLPELFGGLPRGSERLPVRYPVACSPQAWAAGAIPMLLQTSLGLIPDATNHRLFVYRPRLPYWLSQVHIEGFRVGETEVDLSFRRRGDHTAFDLERLTGDSLQIVQTDEWPVR